MKHFKIEIPEFIRDYVNWWDLSITNVENKSFQIIKY